MVGSDTRNMRAAVPSAATDRTAHGMSPSTCQAIGEPRSSGMRRTVAVPRMARTVNAITTEAGASAHTAAKPTTSRPNAASADRRARSRRNQTPAATPAVKKPSEAPRVSTNGTPDVVGSTSEYWTMR